MNPTTKPDVWAEVEAEINALADQHGGRITPEQVIAAARANPSGALYAQFEWNVRKAAQAYWMDQARSLIRRVRVMVTVEDKQFSISAYVRDPAAEPTVQGYVGVNVLKHSQSEAQLAILHEFSMAESYLQRAKNLAAVLNLEEPTAAAHSAVQQAKELAEKLDLPNA